MPEVVYILCALTSIACTWLLSRAWRRSHEAIILWTALGFGGLALSNLILVVDLVFLPDSISLVDQRAFVFFAAQGLLLMGLIREST
jgi:hypothetical protein